MELEERIPYLLKNTDNCFKYKLSYIHAVEDYNDIIRSFKPLMHPTHYTRLTNTSRFIFDTIGYGIFVFIQNGKIHTFQPFANIYQTKPNTNKITTKQMNDLYKNKVTDLHILKQKFYHKIVKERKEWVISGCNFFYWDDWWKDLELYIHIYFDMLSRTISGNVTTCFFINLFDLPILNKEECMRFISNYDATIPIHQYFLPVLSACTTEYHLDDLIVYPDAWELVSQRVFGNECRDLYYNKDHLLTKQWNEKKNKIIFRGRNTSCYPNNFNKNIRLKTSNIINEIIESHTINIDIDIGITDVTTNTLYTDDELVYSKPDKIFQQIERKKGVSMIDQSKNKYILDMDGFVTPWRLCFELSYNSCILLIRSHYNSWFYDELKHNENIYMINQYADVKEELTTALLHFSTHDDDAERIANGSLELYKKIINIDYITAYMMSKVTSPLYNISTTMGGKTRKNKYIRKRSTSKHKNTRTN